MLIKLRDYQATLLTCDTDLSGHLLAAFHLRWTNVIHSFRGEIVYNIYSVRSSVCTVHRSSERHESSCRPGGEGNVRVVAAAAARWDLPVLRSSSTVII